MTDLEQYKETARRAYKNTSFYPEEKAERDLKDLKLHLLSVKEEIDGSQLTNEKKFSIYTWYENKLISLQLSYWSAESRCVSWAITGRGGLNLNQANKTRDIANNQMGELLDFWNYDISKLIAKNLPNEIKSKIKDEADIKSLDSYIQGCLEKAHRYTHQLLQSKIERLINAGKIGTAEYAISKCREHKIFTERNKIFKLFEEMKVKLASLNEKPQNKEYQINGIKILENTEINRLQIFFDGKPDSETISKLKAKAWNWSPRNKAWQRQLTPNAKSSLSYIFAPAN